MVSGRRLGQSRWYDLVAATVPLLSLALCAVAVWLGHRRAGDVTEYLFPAGDRGHPGIVAISTAIGFYSVAVVAGVLALVPAPRRVRHAWSGAAVLFAVVAIDDLMQLHGAVPYGDFIARPVYWISLILVVRRLAPAVRGSHGRRIMVVGLVLLAVSEILDLYPPGDDETYRYYHLFSVFEESTLSIGAWCLAVACLGFAVVVLTPAEVSPDRGARPAPPHPG